MFVDLQQNFVDIYNQLISTLTDDEKYLLQNNFEVALKQQIESKIIHDSL